MFILKKGHQPGVYVPLWALFLVFIEYTCSLPCKGSNTETVRTTQVRSSMNKPRIFPKSLK